MVRSYSIFLRQHGFYSKWQQVSKIELSLFWAIFSFILDFPNPHRSHKIITQKSKLSVVRWFNGKFVRHFQCQRGFDSVWELILRSNFRFSRRFFTKRWGVKFVLLKIYWCTHKRITTLTDQYYSYQNFQGYGLRQTQLKIIWASMDPTEEDFRSCCGLWMKNQSSGGWGLTLL